MNITMRTLFTHEIEWEFPPSGKNVFSFGVNSREICPILQIVKLLQNQQCVNLSETPKTPPFIHKITDYREQINYLHL